MTSESLVRCYRVFFMDTQDAQFLVREHAEHWVAYRKQFPLGHTAYMVQSMGFASDCATGLTTVEYTND